MSERWQGWMSREARVARREAYWNRAKPPRDWRYWVGGTGRVLIVIGLLMFGFVAYQLWGTGIQYAQAQNRLSNEMDELFAEAGVAPATSTTADPTTTSSATAPPVTATDPPSTSTTGAPTTAVPGPTTTIAVPDLEEGQGFAWLDIPSIGLDDVVVVAGVTPRALHEGPGHYPGTPMPGQFGNAAIAGHRTTFGQPFFRLDELVAGDEIVLTTVQGTFVYVVTGSEIVPPDRGDVVLTTDTTTAQLTLTTCDPRYTATNRLIVRAVLDPTRGVAPQPADLDYGQGTEVAAGDDPVATLPGEGTETGTEGATPTEVTTATGAPVSTPSEIEDAFAHGWFSDTAAWPQVALWGGLTAGVAGLGYLVARLLRRRWVGWVVAVAPFIVTLYFFYQNVNRLLPAAL